MYNTDLPKEEEHTYQRHRQPLLGGRHAQLAPKGHVRCQRSLKEVRDRDHYNDDQGLQPEEQLLSTKNRNVKGKAQVVLAGGQGAGV
jgi:hypothetical protein